MIALLPELGLVVLLVAVNAAFAGSELAVVSLREGQLQRLEQQGGRGMVLGKLARDPNRFLSTIQIGITLAGFLASATAAVSLAEPLVGPLSFLGAGAAEATAIVTVTLALTFVTLVFGELAPKRVAMQRAERWGLVVARPLDVLATMARPAVRLLTVSTDLAVRLVGGDPKRYREEVSEEELRDLFAAQETFTQDQRMFISSAFEIRDRTLRQVVVPRREVVTLDGALGCREALGLLAASGHSRAPVVGRDMDDVIGVVHLRDLLLEDCITAERARPIVALPETLAVADAIRRLQREREQLAIVVDEFGAVEGIVTIEDLVEELVGEIYDETDPDVDVVEHEADGAVVLPGSFPLHRLGELGVAVPSAGYTTVAGLLLDRLGHVPQPGEVARGDGWTLEAVDVDTPTVLTVRLCREGRRDADDRPAEGT